MIRGLTKNLKSLARHMDMKQDENVRRGFPCRGSVVKNSTTFVMVRGVREKFKSAACLQAGQAEGKDQLMHTEMKEARGKE